jgi:DNA-binding HxlR family transcriptional regulator
MARMAKTYGQFCSVARTLDAVGDRWALLVVRELLLGPCRYTDLLAGLPGIGTNVLSTRLRQLEDAGVVERRRAPAPAPAVLYELTDDGRGLREVIGALSRWGASRLTHPAADEAVEPRWFVLLLASAVDAGHLDEGSTFELDVDGQSFTLVVDGDRLVLGRGPVDAASPSATLTGPLADFFAAAKGDPDAARRIAVRGDGPAGRTLLDALTGSAAGAGPGPA